VINSTGTGAKMKTRSYYRRPASRRSLEKSEIMAELFAVAVIALAMLPLLWAAAFALTIQ
jgi:hypothetical protein